LERVLDSHGKGSGVAGIATWNNPPIFSHTSRQMLLAKALARKDPRKAAAVLGHTSREIEGRTLFRLFAFWYRPSVKHRIIGGWKRESAAAGRGRMLAILILFWVPVTLILILIGIAHFEQ
jgi:hypothetical protein